jgi:transposase InsO family protein
VVREWLRRLAVKTLFIEPGSPWENGYNGSFNGRLGEELLKREIFSLEAAKVLIEQWRREYNTIRPHSSLAYRPPAPEAIRPDPGFLKLPRSEALNPRSRRLLELTQLGGPALGG